MGNVRPEQIKRVARELMRRFPDKFSNDFENNKHVVNTLTQGATTKTRNQIAGYITRSLAGMEMPPASNENMEESE